MKRFAPLLLLLALIALAHAAPLTEFVSGLNATLCVPNATFNQTPAPLEVIAALNNSGDDYWTMYLLRNQNGTWVNEQAVGTVPPDWAGNLSIYFEADYNGSTKVVDQYALVADGQQVPALGQYFEVVEDWSQYEQQANGQLHDAAWLLVPALITLLGVLLLVLAKWGSSSKADGAYPGEYTMRSLFFPTLSGKPLGEDLADLMIHPVIWLDELLVLLFMTALIGTGLSGAHPLDILALTALGSLCAPLLYFAAVWFYNELVETTPLRFFAGAFLWGCTAAVMTLVFNIVYGPSIAAWLGLSAASMLMVTTVIITPLLEEYLKGIGLLALSGHHEFSDALHGILLGFTVGVGFSFVENWYYFAARTDPLQMGLPAWVALAGYRIVFDTLSHGCFTAALGAVLGWAKSRQWGVRLTLAFVAGVLLAAVLHALFNITAVWDALSAASGNYPTYLFNPVMVLAILLFTGWSLRRARREHLELVQPASIPSPAPKALPSPPPIPKILAPTPKTPVVPRASGRKTSLSRKRPGRKTPPARS